ncbi:MAG: hypothetical protein N4A49_05100 [Marinifilaceae bacterium]|jgi:hypothetical protein|nr:hypothetical protein [Marinifilaceae bacterium]
MGLIQSCCKKEEIKENNQNKNNLNDNETYDSCIREYENIKIPKIIIQTSDQDNKNCENLYTDEEIELAPELKHKHLTNYTHQEMQQNIKDGDFLNQESNFLNRLCESKVSEYQYLLRNLYSSFHLKSIKEDHVQNIRESLKQIKAKLKSTKVDQLKLDDLQTDKIPDTNFLWLFMLDLKKNNGYPLNFDQDVKSNNNNYYSDFSFDASCSKPKEDKYCYVNDSYKNSLTQKEKYNKNTDSPSSKHNDKMSDAEDPSERDEGYLASLYLPFFYIINTFKTDLSLDYYKKLSKLMRYFVAVEGYNKDSYVFIHEKKNNATISYGINHEIPDHSILKKFKGNRLEYVDINYNILQENTNDAIGYIGADGKSISLIQKEEKSITIIFNEIVDGLKKEISSTENKSKKLLAIADFYIKLERLHLLTDGNSRLNFLVLNKLLIENGFCPCFLMDFNLAYCKTPEEMAKEIYAGMRIWKSIFIDNNKGKFDMIDINSLKKKQYE